ncbi:MAG TPA: response regulator transcription factor [Chitinophagaceae bacterium]|nr:response regulator transcription factor [Chitinophagaceae bacterium]HNU13560.1 response regulator transcription factor [Chitinophagaceae bacterium]
MRQISVFIVDDNKELRNALEEIVTMSEGYKCAGTVGSAEDAVIQIPILKPDVVLMDINLGTEESGIDVVRVLKPRIPDTNFMICTVYEEDEKIFEALSAGASGYILKKTPPGRMLEAIRELYEGGAPMSSQIARKVVAAFQQQQTQHAATETEKLNMLTNREMEILELLSRGLMYKEIASQTFLSPETVRKHVYHIYEKLHVTNRVAAVNKFYGR